MPTGLLSIGLPSPSRLVKLTIPQTQTSPQDCWSLSVGWLQFAREAGVAQHRNALHGAARAILWTCGASQSTGGAASYLLGVCWDRGYDFVWVMLTFRFLDPATVARSEPRKMSTPFSAYGEHTMFSGLKQKGSTKFIVVQTPHKFEQKLKNYEEYSNFFFFFLMYYFFLKRAGWEFLFIYITWGPWITVSLKVFFCNIRWLYPKNGPSADLDDWKVLPELL